MREDEGGEKERSPCRMKEQRIREVGILHARRGERDVVHVAK